MNNSINKDNPSNQSLNWEQIHLGNFHNFFEDWDKEFGISTHAHGMYHLEFYKKISEIVKRECAFLSGIFGDVWAGNVPKININSPKDLIKLSYSHGLYADKKKIKIKKKQNYSTELRDQFWITNKKKTECFIAITQSKMVPIAVTCRRNIS